MRHSRPRHASRLLAAAMMMSIPFAARADICLSSNDAHTVLDPGNLQVAAKDAKPDTLSMIDLSRADPRIIETIDVPGSVVGPPTAVWIAADESWAIVTAATKADPAGPSGISPDDRVSVIDLTAKPPKIVQQISAGAGATTVRVSPDGGLALIANRTEGTISVFSIKDKRLQPASKLDLGKQSGPSGMVFMPDGKSVLVSRNFDHQLSLLRIEGTNLVAEKRPITTGVAPYTFDVNPAGSLAAVSNMGRGDGDMDTVSLIDLTVSPPRTVNTVSVGWSPEGLKWSPDGKFLALGLQNGTTRPPSSPFLRPRGRLLMLAVDGQNLHPVAEAPIGRWTQGIAFSRDGHTVLVQAMVEQEIAVFRFDGSSLTARPPLAIGAGPAAIVTSWK